MRKELGKYLLDVSKLIFGGVILSGLMNLNVNSVVLFVVGGSTVLLTALSGFMFLKDPKIETIKKKGL